MAEDQLNQLASIVTGAELPTFVARLHLPQLLYQAAQGKGAIVHLTSDHQEVVQTYADLWREANFLLQGLRADNSQSRYVILHCAESRSFLSGFWACVLGGFVPVPIALAPEYETDNSKTALLRHAAQMLGQALLLTEPAYQATVQQFCDRSDLSVQVVSGPLFLNAHQGDGLEDFEMADGPLHLPFLNARQGYILGDFESGSSAGPLNPPILGDFEIKGSTSDDQGMTEWGADDLALLLFTSGSTGVPKGVKLSYGNLCSSLYGMATVNQFTADSISLNWMPLEHVASLVMFHLTQVYVGCSQLQVANARILQDPLQWMDLVDRYRVTHTWAPNFAYGLIGDRAEEVQQRSWDLSCLRWMGNGAEAVVGKTTRRFLQLLMPKGLGPRVVSPGYGMSETCSGIVHSHEFSLETSSDEDAFVNVGRPIPGVSLRVVNEQNQTVPEGTIGRLQVQGATVMQGYYQRPDLDRTVLTEDGWFDTGDLALLQAGRLTITGRQKEVIILNGVNYYNHEIEAAIEELEGIAMSFTAACAVRRSEDASDRVAIFFHPDQLDCDRIFAGEDSQIQGLIELIKSIRRQVVQAIGITPTYVIPVNQADIPKTNLGKIQRSQLVQRFVAGDFDPIVQRIESAFANVAIGKLPQTEMEQKIAEIWRSVLQLSAVSTHDNFFELGGTSLLLMQVLQRLQTEVDASLTAVILFQYPTIAALAQSLQHQPQRLELPQRTRAIGNADIAVIGMACRFPGANSIEQFWQNLCDGVESISFFSDAEILASGIDPALLQHPDYVKASPILDCDIAGFDAEFFGYSPKEASLLDPQQRFLLECAWEGLEDAGYDPLNYTGAIGLYAGASTNTYLLNNVYPNRHQLDEQDSLQVLTLSSMGGFQLATANDKDYLTTRVSYKLNLTGPSVNVQTACSTSLVAIHMARQSLLNGECDLAMAGGVSVHTPEKVGHLYQEGMILTRDGHCRAFDAQASGTIFGSGAGIVVLKRLDRAIADNDRIYAVIKGSAIGNDGNQKVGYFAPRAEGQAIVTATAIDQAGIDPKTIGYVEAHGTGTALGDPIEITGLSQAFRLSTSERQFCAIGSVKTNVGHLNIASGVVGFIKAALCLHHKQIPPSLHFESPNPQIDFANSPFYVNTQLQGWSEKEYPRRAGVNSLGIGGTNVHIILEECAELNQRPKIERSHHLLTLSARTPAALETLVRQYTTFLETHPATDLADLCFTANVGRSHFEHRLGFVVASLDELQQKLAVIDRPPKFPKNGGLPIRSSQFGDNHLREQSLSGSKSPRMGDLGGEVPKIAFLFPGQGSQYGAMGRELYQTCSHFRETLDRCNEILQPLLDRSILDLIWRSDALLDQTIYTQPALFAIEYGLAQLWRSWGIEPAAVMGHSVGEYVAACVAGVFSLEDALRLVATRGKLMQQLPCGSMAAVMADEDQVRSAIMNWQDKIQIAAVNSKMNVVIAGESATVQQVMQVFTRQGIRTTLLTVSHAFHSPLMQPILPEFQQVAQQIQYRSPQIPVISNLTGRAADRSIATPNYWCDHICQPVQFAAGMETLVKAGFSVFLECGPKPILSGMAQADYAEHTYLPSLRSDQPNWQSSLNGLAKLYKQGVSIDWSAVHHAHTCQRISLPHYPFQRQRYWLDRPTESSIARSSSANTKQHPLLGERIPSPQQVFYESTIAADQPAFLSDHQVHSQVIFPAAAWIEMMLSVGRKELRSVQLRLEEIEIHQALVLSEQLTTLQLSFSQQTGVVQIYRLVDSESDPENWQHHCSGKLSKYSQSIPAVDVEQLRKTFTQVYSAVEHYSQCQSEGLNYGPAFQAVQQLWYREGAALAKIQLPHSLIDSASSYCFHPVLLDAAFQAIAAARSDVTRSSTYLPIAVKQFNLIQLPNPSEMLFWSYVQLDESSDRSILTAKIQLLNQQGKVLALIEGLTLKRLDRPSAQSSQIWQTWLYEISWQPQEKQAEQSFPKAGAWLIFADRQGIARQLANRLKIHDQKYYLVYPHHSQKIHAQSEQEYSIDPTNPIEFEQLLIQIGQQTALSSVIYLWSLDALEGPIEEAIEQNCRGALALIQALAAIVFPQSPRCYWVTCGAQAVENRSIIYPTQACLWGLGKVAVLEHPELSNVLIDLDPDDLTQAADRLLEELRSIDAEDQIAFSEGRRYVPRLVQADDKALHRSLQPSQPTRLEIQQRGTLDQMSWQPTSRRSPAAHEVEIRVHATGLNFRDLLNVLDRYPGEAGLLGLECSGAIVAIGDAVQNLNVGDAVMAIAPGSFSQFVTVDVALVALKPETLDFTAAATLPTAFLTAYYALHHIANIQKGDRILIHAAAGGVGLAAIQIAKKAGAEIFATASPGKWAFLRTQGIQHCFNSRTLDFAEAVRSAGGVDLVLNSLSGEFIPQSLSVLRPGGRFLEIGKTEIWPSDRVAVIRPDVTYCPIDLFEMTQTQPDRIQALLAELLPYFQSGQFKPLPQTAFPAEQAIDAFRFMQQAKQIGKIVITQSSTSNLSDSISSIVHPDAAYLITGGYGGLGLQVAQSLVDQGATHLILLGRNAPSAIAENTIQSLRHRGIMIDCLQADVSNFQELSSQLAPYFSLSSPPLKGIIHAAGLLDDATLLQQTWDRFETVMAAKTIGAWNLHCLSQNLPIDFFVLFSSAASLIGSAGQANYAAANAFLDALAHFRRSIGLPALSINWAAWSQVGMAAQREISLPAGMAAIDPAQGLAIFSHLLSNPQIGPQVGVLPIDRAVWSAPALPFFDVIRDGTPISVQSPSMFLEQLRSSSLAEVRSQLSSYVSQQVAKILGISPMLIDPQQGLLELGIDSLTAIELRNLLQTHLGCRLPTTLLFDYPTVAALTDYLAQQLCPEAIDQPHTIPAESASETSAIEQLSESEAEALLLQELDRLFE